MNAIGSAVTSCPDNYYMLLTLTGSIIFMRLASGASMILAPTESV